MVTAEGVVCRFLMFELGDVVDWAFCLVSGLEAVLRFGRRGVGLRRVRAGVLAHHAPGGEGDADVDADDEDVLPDVRPRARAGRGQAARRR